MTNSVTPKETALAQIELNQAMAAAKRYAEKSRSDATWRAYRNDWRQFDTWCRGVGVPSLPATAETISMFLASQADTGLSPSTLTRRLAAIRLVHLGAGHVSAHNALTVTEVMRGIRRNWGKSPAKKKAAIDEDIKKMADAVEPETRKGIRDRALLLFGFAGAFRRSELVRLNTWDLDERSEGLKVTIAKSKTDQEGFGQSIGVLRVENSPYCPVQAVKDWVTVAGIEKGALFRRMFRGDSVGQTRLSSQSISLVVKDLAYRAGLNPGDYAGHSLRSGFLTSAAQQNASIFKMADQSRHTSLDVLRGYVREESLFDANAGGGLLASRDLDKVD
ncbi:MAG: tyrosine-type recombinase/integrase [Pseudomonadota bacterium]